jgi:hypothetical protein
MRFSCCPVTISLGHPTAYASSRTHRLARIDESLALVRDLFPRLYRGSKLAAEPTRLVEHLSEGDRLRVVAELGLAIVAESGEDAGGRGFEGREEVSEFGIEGENAAVYELEVGWAVSAGPAVARAVRRCEEVITGDAQTEVMSLVVLANHMTSSVEALRASELASRTSNFPLAELNRTSVGLTTVRKQPGSVSA